MQQLLSICDIYAKEHDLLYNGGKSYSLCFKPKCSTFNRPTFSLNHLNFPNVNQSKYLGIDNDNDNEISFILTQVNTSLLATLLGLLCGIANTIT